MGKDRRARERKDYEEVVTEKGGGETIPPVVTVEIRGMGKEW